MYMQKRTKNQKGKNNSFYGKHHTDESKKKIGGAVHDYSGKNNPMYGKSNYDVWLEKYGKDIADLKQKKSNYKNKLANSGKNNAFYGKTHSLETISVIKEKNRIYRENNKQKLLKIQKEKLNLTDDILIESFNYYKNNICNFDTLKEKFEITCDHRMIKKYWLETGVTDAENLRKITKLKQFLSDPTSRSKSAIEVKIFNLLKEKYGEQNVKHSFVIFPYPYIYDIILFDKVLIEYDGYYWHKERKSKNDDIKTQIANEHDYILYRIEEDNKRKINIDKEFEMIDNIVKQNSLAPKR